MLKPPSGREIVMSECPKCDAIGEMNRDDSYPPGTIWEPLSAGGGIHVPDREPCLRRQLAMAQTENTRLREVVFDVWNTQLVQIEYDCLTDGEPLAPCATELVAVLKRLKAAASKPEKETQ